MKRTKLLDELREFTIEELREELGKAEEALFKLRGQGKEEGHRQDQDDPARA